MIHFRLFFLRPFFYFVLCCFALFSNRVSFADIDKSLVRRGKFYCVPGGKIVVVRSQRGISGVECITQDGKRYNAINGNLISSAPKSGKPHSGTCDKAKTENNKKIDIPCENEERAKKHTVIINNYHKKKSLTERASMPLSRNKNRKDAERKEKKEREEVKNLSKKPFNGFYVGFGYGFGINSISQNLSMTGTTLPNPGGSTAPFPSNNMTATINTNQLDILVGFNLHVHKLFAIGFEGGGVLFVNSAIPVPDGSIFSENAITSFRDLAFAQVRLGLVLGNKVFLYGGAGVSLSDFKFYHKHDPQSLHPELSWKSSSNISIAPRFSAGAELLLIKHLILRFEYSFSYFLQTGFSSIDRSTSFGNSGDEWSFSYQPMEHLFRVIIGYKF